LGKPYGDKTQVLLGIYWGMYLGTLWEHDGNTLRTRKNKIKNPSPPTSSKRN